MAKSISISVQHLKIGMFVSKLDRAWLETPFPLEGVWINSPDDINKVKLYCDMVWIDPDKSWFKNLDLQYRQKHSKPVRETPRFSGLTRHRHEGQAGATISFADEIAGARTSYSQANQVIGDIMRDIEAGRTPAFGSVKDAVTNMLDSIHRNSDALLWLTLLKDKHNYTYQHCLDVSIHMMNFGKYLGLPKIQQHLVGVAGLLQDIGKTRLPSELLNKQEKLSDEEKKLTQEHVRHSLDIIARSPFLHRTVGTIIEQHHERYDGKGYPAGLKGDRISMFGSMSSIVDTYNAMLSQRPGGAPCSSFQAITALHEGKGTAYHPALVERFIQCIGVYSPGTICELNTGELALVIEQNKTRRLCPKLLVIFDSGKNPYASPYVIDLLDEPSDADQAAHSIKRVVEPHDYQIDLQRYYL
ncbi:MAG: HD-GYP domain-containing protein [Methylococcaceae bacterium]|nr:HD-GYP domain-containing protein [Methylococcaceae bacterium]